MKQVLRGVGRYWADKADEGRSSLEVLAWHAAAELASFVELTMEPADLHLIAPKAYQVLWGLDAYFQDVGQLPPQEMALVMLMIERVNAGLTPRGDETEIGDGG